MLCAVTLSPCTSVELISLSLQLLITCSMRQYNILQSAVSSLASFQTAQCPSEHPCTLRYTSRPFMLLPYGHFPLFITLHSHHTISINELCISYIAIGYTHMVIIANVYAYTAMGELEGRLVHLSSPPGCTLWAKYLKENTDGVCEYSVLAL